MEWLRSAVQGWMEHISDTATIVEWGKEGYWGEVRRRNEEGREDEKKPCGGVGLAFGMVIALYVVYLGVVGFYNWVSGWVQ